MRHKRLVSWMLTFSLLLGMLTVPAQADNTVTITDSSGTGQMTITLTIPAAPTAASAAKDSITLTEADGCEYSMDGTTWQDSTTFSGLNPGTTYTFYQRVKGTQNISAAATISTAADTYAMTITLTIKPTPETPAAPTAASTDKTSVTLTAVDGCEYSMDGENWQDSTTFSGLNPGTAYTFYQRVKATNSANASASSNAATISTAADTYAMTITLTIKPTPDAPAAPTAASTNKTSVTLTAVDGCEYSMDGTTWQDSTTFSGLNPGTAYTFYQRIKATDSANASASSPAANISTAADTYAMTITLTIKEKATGTVTGNTLTYSGEAQNLVTPGTPTGGTFQYLIGSSADTAPTGGYSTTVPQGTNVGTYYVWYKVVGDDNHRDSDPACVTVSIGKAGINPSVSLTGWTDGSTPNTPSVTGNTGSGAVTYEYKAKNADDSTYTTTVPSTPGDYTVRATIAETDNYNSKTATADFTIAANTSSMVITLVIKAKATADPAPTANTLTYTGAAQALVTDGTASGGTLQYALGDSSETAPTTGWGETVPTGTNAGTYDVWYKIVGDNDHADSEPIHLTATIAKAEITPSVTLTGWTDGNTPNTPSVTGNTGSGTVTYEYKVKGAENSTYTTIVPSTPGDYTVRATIAETDNYNGGTATVDFTITAWTSTMTITLTIKEKATGTVTGNTLTYSGEAQNLVTPGTPTGGTFQYQIGSSADTAPTGGYSTTVPQGTNVGTYYVWYKIVGDSDHRDSNPACVTVTIGAKSISGATVTLDKTQTTYNGAAQSVTVQSVTLDGTTLTSSDYDVSGDTSGTNPNTYTVTVTGKGNYKDSATTTWTITNKAMTITAEPVSVTYDGQPHGITVSVTDPASGATVKYGTTEGTYDMDASPTITNVSDSPLTVYYQVTADNYETVTGSQTVTITKADSSTTAPTAKTLTYSGAAQELVTAGTASGGTMQYAIGTDGTTAPTTGYGTAIPTGTDAGTYYVWYKVEGDNDHQDSDSACVTVTISKAAIDPAVSMSGWTYGGTAASPSVTDNSGNGSVTYAYKLKTAEDEAYDSAVPVQSGEYKVRAVIAETDNYSGKTVEGEFGIAKAPLTVTASNGAVTYGDAPKGFGVTYSGFVNSDTESVLSGTVSYTFDYTQYGNVGTYKITPSGLSAANYEISYTDGALTVNPKTIGLTWGDTSFVYDGTSKLPTATATGLVDGDSCTVTVIAAQTDVGSYTATASTLSNENYALPAENTVSFTITVGTQDGITADGWTGTYDGAAHSITVSASSGGTVTYSEAQDGEYSAENPSYTNAGTYTVYYKL